LRGGGGCEHRGGVNDYDAWSEPVESIMEAYAAEFDDMCRGGIEMNFEWFASDAAGHIGVFSKNEEVYLPRSVLQDKAKYLCVIESLLRLPFPEPLTAEESRAFCYAVQYRRRGVYVFETARSVPTRYEVIERPPQPVTIEILPLPAQAYLRRFCIEWVRFADGRLIDFVGVGDMSYGP